MELIKMYVNKNNIENLSLDYIYNEIKYNNYKLLFDTMLIGRTPIKCVINYYNIDVSKDKLKIPNYCVYVKQALGIDYNKIYTCDKCHKCCIEKYRSNQIEKV